MHTRRASLLSTTLLATSLFAQSYTAYPIDDLHGSYGHWAPFGSLSTGGSDECRSQYLIPAQFLPPGGALLSGLEASPHIGGNVPYARLIIRCGLTTVPVLSTTFANNAASLVTVFSQTNFSINWASSSTWYPIAFATPFPWDGSSNLLIEIERVVDRPNNPSLGTISIQLNNAPMRKDLPYPVFAEGSYNSGAATRATGLVHGVPPLFRLRWYGNPALTITSTRPNGSYYGLGATVTLKVQAAPAELFAIFLDDTLASTPIQAPPIVGGYWLTRFIVLGSGTVPATGPGSLVVVVPPNPSLVGGKLWFQGGVVGTSRFILTNVVDANIAQ